MNFKNPISRLLLCCIFVMLIFGTLTACNHLFYQPSKEKFFDPSRFKLKYEEKIFQLNDGQKVMAWYFPATKKSDCAKTLLVHFHGNAQNISTHFMQMAWLPQTGVDYLIFDYPGYGESNGEAQRDTIHKNTVLLINSILLNTFTNEFKDHKIVLYGQSLGGAILLGVLPELQFNNRVKQIVIESSFISYRHIANTKLAQTWLTWPFQWLAYLLITDKHSGKGRLAQMKLPPILVMHGDADPVVPIEEAESILKELPPHREYWPIKGAHHLQILTPEFGIREKLMERFCRP